WGSCSGGWGGRRRRRPSTARPWRSGRSWPRTPPPCPTTGSTWEAVVATSGTWSGTATARPTVWPGTPGRWPRSPPWSRRGPGWPAAGLFLRNAHGGGAEVLGRLGRPAAALPDWDRAVELTPPAERPPARAGRAGTLARAGRVGEAAVEVDELAKGSGWPA